ncbi:MAG: hypothetical protein LBF15_03100 [Candidatus Peribacteria bacterium]|jgi:hypothetical protein|nr:hypothetical protein [Candidatus Peribacteria bacterium]
MERGKQVIMISNKFTANKKVVDYKDPNYMYIDTNHTEEKYAIIKSILKDKNKTIVDILPKKLIEKLSRISIDEKQKIIEWAINIQNKRYLNKEEIPSTFMNGGKDLTYIDRDLIYSDDKKGLKIVNVIFY